MNEEPIDHDLLLEQGHRLTNFADIILLTEGGSTDRGALPPTPPESYDHEELVEVFRFLSRCGMIGKTEAEPEKAH